MEITNLGFYGLNKPQLQTKPEKHDNKAVANHTDIVSKAGNSAIRSMAMANIHRSMNIRQAGNNYKVEGKYKIIGEQTAEQANDFWKSVGYTDSPYKPNKKAQIIELTQDTKFVRTYDGKNSGMYGSWVMKYDDIKGLKPEEIADKFALPQVPKYMCDCTLPKGTQLRTGECNPLYGWKGGGQQFDMMGARVGKFDNEREIPTK